MLNLDKCTKSKR